MNDKDLEESLEKTRKQIDIAAEIWLYALHTAKRLVDEHLPCYREAISKAVLLNEKNTAMESHQVAISTVLANLLQLSESIRV